jgi:eukaryotic-like serine/threonine-protein kinase
VPDIAFWERVDAIFAEAVELDRDVDARARLVNDRCAGHEALRAELLSLLAAHDASGAFLGPAPGRSTSGEDPVPHIGPGTIVGVYRLTGKIGEGGMGDVYRAERADGLFGHAVALKVTRSSLVDPDASRRFRIERQVLASLSHPHIVTLLDGGTLPDGRAYLVMALVDGTAITRYCREGRLGLDDRVRLFRQVCSAVQHAHRHGIVHRDLKPGNVLVTADGASMVLDFGVAKLIAETPGERPRGGRTATGLFPGPLTPNYASPEQMRGLPVTTASDVYALGILLYELVTGVRPYETAGQPFDRVMDLVVRGEPARPSAAPPPAGDSLPYDRRRLRGDLDAVVMKAMEREPERRYASAGQLADDVARWSANQPVFAREPSALYLLRKLASRHTLAVGIAVLAFAAIVAGSGVALWQRQVAERERGRAERRFAEVRQLANTLIFTIHDAIVPLAGSTPVRKTIVTEALGYLERLQREADGDAALHYELSGAYLRIASVLGDPQTANLGDRAGALASLRRAEQLIAPQAQPPDASMQVVERYVTVQRQLATLLQVTGRPDEAHAAGQAAVSRAQQRYTRDPGDGGTRQLLASALFTAAWNKGGTREALPIWERAGALYDQVLAAKPDDPARMRNVALVEKYIGGVYDRLDEDTAAAPHYRRALALDERRLALMPDDPQARLDTAIDLANIAVIVEHGPEWRGAIALRVRSVAIRRTLVAADPQNVLVRNRLGVALAALARVEARAGDVGQALIHGEEAVALHRQTLHRAPDTPSRVALADSLESLARIHGLKGDRAGRCRAYREAVSLYHLISPSGAAPANTGASKQRPLAEQGVAACDSGL